MARSEFEHNLSLLLKLFKNRPNHLARFLINNNCLTEEFKDMVLNNYELNELDSEEVEYEIDFSDYDEMNSYYDKYISTDISNKTIDTDLHRQLNIRLLSLISEEKFEDAAKLRDYMKKKNIKIIV